MVIPGGGTYKVLWSWEITISCMWYCRASACVCVSVGTWAKIGLEDRKKKVTDMEGIVFPTGLSFIL